MDHLNVMGSPQVEGPGDRTKSWLMPHWFHWLCCVSPRRLQDAFPPDFKQSSLDDLSGMAGTSIGDTGA